jgi:hypothetical protein
MKSKMITGLVGEKRSLTGNPPFEDPLRPLDGPNNEVRVTDIAAEILDKGSVKTKVSSLFDEVVSPAPAVKGGRLSANIDNTEDLSPIGGIGGLERRRSLSTADDIDEGNETGRGRPEDAEVVPKELRVEPLLLPVLLIRISCRRILRSRLPEARRVEFHAKAPTRDSCE